MHRAETLNVHHMNKLSLVSPDFFQSLRFQILRWKTSKGWKKWAIQFSLQKSTGAPFCEFLVFFEFEFVFKLTFWFWICFWIWNLHTTYSLELESDKWPLCECQKFLRKKNSLSSSSLSLQESKLIYIFCCHSFICWWEWSKRIPFVR